MSDDKNDDGNVGSENSRGFKQPPPPRGRPPVPSAEQIAARKNAESARLTVEQEYDESLVERRASGQPIRPAPPLPSSSNQQAQDNYHAQQAAFDVAMGEWNAGNYTVDDDNESVSTFNSDDSFEQDGNNKAIEAHSDGSTHRDSPISEDTENELRGIFGAGKKAITELKESNQALNRSNSALINEWEEQSIVVKDQTKETKTKEKLEPGEIAVSNYKDTGKRQYRVFINGLGLTSGFLDDDTDLSDAQAVKDIVIRDLNTTYIDYNVDTFPPIDFNDEVMFKNYLAQMEVINEAAYEINKPAILKNEGLFGRLGDLASRDRADKSYKDQFKELAPNAMREAFLAQKVTVGVAGIDQKMIVMKDLPDYYKAQIKSKKSQLVGIGNASGGTQVRDRAELEAQIEDCKVMERSLRILVDAAYDPRMKSAQFLDMQKSGMETISKQMAAAGVRLKNFEKGIINNKIKVAGGTLTAGAVATAGYFMYGWITSGTATANAISDTAAMEAWFNGAGATMGSWGSSASSW
ncbi:MAG: hypothetical protein P1U36_08795, partial [Legionellaceae bacterium]|nr:hypothetical protein [Legionellaceae bacterium]